MKTAVVRLTLLGVGAMNSPRYAPAGLLVEYKSHRVMIDGGVGAEPSAPLHCWLVTDEQSELIAEIRKLARSRGLVPRVASYSSDNLAIKPHSVVHTSHDAYGYLIEAEGRKIVWAPEFLEFPSWAGSADLMFAEAAGWNRAIYFSAGAGGHTCALEVARLAQRRGIKRLVFAHIGRPTIRAVDSETLPPFGEFAKDGDIYFVSRARAIRKRRARDLKGERTLKRPCHKAHSPARR